MTVKENVFRDLLRLFVWYPVRWLILLLPVPMGIAFMGRMGDLHYLLSKGHKQAVLKNLYRIWPDDGSHRTDEYEAVLRLHFRLHYIDRLLIYSYKRFDRKLIDRLISFEGLEHLDLALKAGKGVVLVHGHIGPVHVPLVALSVLGYKLKQIGLPSDDGLSWVGRNVAFRLRLYYEAKIPAEIINADAFIRPVYRCLAKNGIIMVTGDGTGTERRIGKQLAASLCGQAVRVPLGPATVATKTGGALVPMFIKPPAADGRLRIIIEPPLTSSAKGEEGIVDMTGQFISRLESYIIQNPGYMHFIDRFAPGSWIDRE